MTQNKKQAFLENGKDRSRFNFFLRSIAWLLCLAFVCQDIAHAAPVLSLNARDFISDPSRLKISSRIANISEIHKGQKSRLIVHIQDAHANPSAQRNLSKILEE